jgi:D-glycero-D-manno-heptose 1,7-bisphosphate phosphatase
MKTRRGVFLDRDGVLNKVILKHGKPCPPQELGDVVILPGVIEAIDLLREFGFEIVAVTNQPDVSRGTVSESQVKEINRFIGDRLNIQHFYTCFHDDLDECICRKPKPGLLTKAADDLHIDLSLSVMIGDRWRDIAAGQSIGCKCYFIDYSYQEKRPDPPYIPVTSLLEATQRIVRMVDDSLYR